MENVENVNIFYGKVNFKSQIINFNFYFLYISNAKIKCSAIDQDCIFCVFEAFF